MPLSRIGHSTTTRPQTTFLLGRIFVRIFHAGKWNMRSLSVHREANTRSDGLTSDPNARLMGPGIHYDNAEPTAWSGRGMERPVCIRKPLAPRRSGRSLGV